MVTKSRSGVRLKKGVSAKGGGDAGALKGVKGDRRFCEKARFRKKVAAAKPGSKPKSRTKKENESV